MCVECGCEVPQEEQEEVHDDNPVVHLPGEMAGELKDRVPVALDYEGMRIALVRADDHWFAFDDTCTHQGCSLAKGEVHGSSIVCPCHGGTFDMASGAVLAGPPPRPIQTYRVLIEDDDADERSERVA
jgi:3-phenylpropionate/trans-cinnamate dioxygenase ferredoxin subunit